MADNKALILYFDRLSMLDDMTDEEAGAFFKGVVEYAREGREPDFRDRFMRHSFTSIKPDIDYASSRYEEIIRKRSEAGKKSAEAKKKKAEQASTSVDFVDSAPQHTSTSVEFVDNTSQQIQLNNTKQDNTKQDKTIQDKTTQEKTMGAGCPPPCMAGTPTPTKKTKQNAAPQSGAAGVSEQESSPKSEEYVPAPARRPYFLTGGKPPNGRPVPPVPRDSVELVVTMFNNICTSYTPVEFITDEQNKAILFLFNLMDNSRDKIRTLFEKAERSDFLKGNNSRGWKADLNWLMKRENMEKVMEGKYDK